VNQVPVKVLSAGIIVVDHVCAPIERLPRSGELVLTDGCDLFIGGCAANVAIDLTKLGLPVRVVGAIGRDPLGEFAEETLAGSGIDTSQLVFVEGLATSQTLVVNVAGDDRRFIHLKGANDQLKAGQIAETLSPGIRVLYLGGLFLMDGLVPGEVADLFRTARRQGIRTVLDVVTPGPRSYESALREILPETDLFLPNEDEGELITGHSSAIEQGRVFRQWGAKSVVITRGEKGSLYLSDDEAFHATAYPMKFVDGTGGGDAFSAGYISGLVDGLDAVGCVARGTALGGSCVQERGATVGVWNRQQLEEYLGACPLKVGPLSMIDE
jgi:sugar/nucleoside kinase (ribokinase family)